MALPPPRPLTQRFKIVPRFDPALDRERYDEDSEVVAWKALPDEEREKTPEPMTFERAYGIALERLDFQPLLKAGEAPTYLVFRPIDNKTMRRLIDLYGSNFGAEGLALILRIALIGIENWPDSPNLDREKDSKWGDLVPYKVIAALDEVAASLGAPFGALTSELAQHVVVRSAHISGK
jgi:hypothetical protein